jgi:hypothetical protein
MSAVITRHPAPHPQAASAQHPVESSLARSSVRREKPDEVRRVAIFKNCKLCQHSGPLAVHQSQRVPRGRVIRSRVVRLQLQAPEISQLLPQIEPPGLHPRIQNTRRAVCSLKLVAKFLTLLPR